jgi:hypothetical protein
MTQDRLTALLAAAAQHRLSGAEEAELARLLEDPANRERADRDLRGFRHRVGVLWDYQQALAAGEPSIPEARLEALLATVQARQPEPQAAPARSKLRRWIGPLAAAAALAASVTLVIWLQRPAAGAAPRFEFGVVASLAPSVVRGANEPRGPGLGGDWRQVPQRDLAALRAWSSGDLSAGVAARVWCDEEAGMLRARYRRADGSVGTAERKLESEVPVPEQVRRFGTSLSGAGGRP